MICYEKRIFFLYLFFHSIYFLQSLNIVIFGFLQKIYGDLVNQKSELGVDFINKNLFINFYTEIREYIFRFTIIKIGFKIINLIFLNFEKIYKRLS